MLENISQPSLTEQYTPWIKKITNRMWHKFNKFHAYDDLLSVAYIASLEAEAMYDPEKAKFSAYIKPRIEGAIIRSVSNISSTQHSTLLAMQKFIDDFLEKHSKIPAQHIILKHLDITEKQFLAIIDSTVKIQKVSPDDLPEDALLATQDLDSLAEYARILPVIETLPIADQTILKNFMEGNIGNSAKVNSILSIIRKKLNITEG